VGCQILCAALRRIYFGGLWARFAALLAEGPLAFGSPDRRAGFTSTTCEWPLARPAVPTLASLVPSSDNR